MRPTTLNSAKDEQTFQYLYLSRLERMGAEAILEALEGITQGSPAVLLCWEKNPAECHRRDLAEWLEREAGLVIPELTAGDVPPRGTRVSWNQDSLF